MKIDEAIEEFDFFNEGDYITRGMAEAKDIVFKKLQETESDLYEANKRIADLLLILGDKDRMINAMVDYMYKELDFAHTREEVIKYFEERCKDAKD